MSLILPVDSRRRLSLGALAKHTHYIVDVQPDGTIVLTPAVVLPATEVKENKNATR